MAIYVKPKWRKYIPHLEVYVNVPVIRVQMMAFTKEADWLRYTYLGFGWEIWKWRGEIRLFQNNREFYPPYVSEKEVNMKHCGCWEYDKELVKRYCNKHWSSSSLDKEDNL